MLDSFDEMNAAQTLRMDIVLGLLRDRSLSVPETLKAADDLASFVLTGATTRPSPTADGDWKTWVVPTDGITFAPAGEA